MASLATLHAKHIFDFDATRSSQYFYLTRSSATSTPFLTLSNYMINQTVAQAQAILAPFMTAALALPGITLVSSSYTYALINDILYMTDDSAGFNVALGSRLIPATTYRNSPQTVGKVYKELLDGGALECVIPCPFNVDLMFLTQDSGASCCGRFV
jgi:hypothetical protein